MATLNRNDAIEGSLGAWKPQEPTYGIASDYDESLRDVLRSEGGYSNDAGDPGGPTKYGITIFDARMYWKPHATAADVRAMPLSVAKDIYAKKYWAKMRCDELPAGIDYAVFDYGVNSGVGRAAAVLRNVVRLPRGTAIDDTVISALARFNTVGVINDICDERIAFLRRLRTWSIFGRGWARRVAEVRAASIAMEHKAASRPQPPDVEPAPPDRLPWWMAFIRMFSKPSGR
jgi:lysozyme family protein